MTHRRAFTTALLASALTLTLITASHPQTPDTAPLTLDAASTYLQKHPGGTKLNSEEVQYGPIIVTATQTTAKAGADCPAGWFCFYTGTSYTGTRGKLSSCGRQDLTQYDWGNRIESAYYDLNNGRVTFYDRANASNPNDDKALFTISTATRGDPDTTPHRDKADYVYRTC